MSKRKIMNFFPLTEANVSSDNNTLSTEDDSRSIKRKTIRPSVKKVKKWEKELHVSLTYELDDDGNVAKIFCALCCAHNPDQTSSVWRQYCIIIFFTCRLTFDKNPCPLNQVFE